MYGEISNDFPEILIITARCYPLRDEGLAYAKVLKAVGVTVHHQFDVLCMLICYLMHLLKKSVGKIFR
ncbi:alpha/beta hydrolase fold domain-containing protein [Colwellia sp. MB3u-28]|nr:alpha/beta hydrolase fold domain-containing protein [Colwellia sp. MB02u-7]MBA6235471.1 alpha/beta hydrolase fold domain-containing protein [Colwellia sp. MB02u-11]MBA6258023.1 alpha/beta hydrolase fold domain-containing protein [Colwellia sp. MB3u-28]MBA6259717.1 alpha/beta hydrolase fold domain-containing protein [Colwellia sp. MB3u-41]MBA6299803.1 alpha/beta hydrolase fold domain-containing protein [Colwellia sp. MB3u-22]MBA6305428.1 alpha/beta hydrolase fold domain-containing protein [C